MKRRVRQEEDRAIALADAFAEDRGLLAHASREFIEHDGTGEWSVWYRYRVEPGSVVDPSHAIVIVDIEAGVARFLGEPRDTSEQR